MGRVSDVLNTVLAAATTAVSAAAALAQAQTENVKPLTAESLFVVLAGIGVVGFAIILAGLGYFTFSDDDK
jgi:hypothetical protein